MHPRGVVLHLTGSTYGDRDVIDQWHRDNGWSEIGYHRVILNGKPKSKSAYDAARDGEVQKGRADHKMGAHCKSKGMNTCTFGISSVGDPGTVPAGATQADAALTTKKYLTAKQAKALVDLVARMCIQFGWDPKGTFKHPDTGATVNVISQHSDHEPAKPFCASLNLPAVRDAVAARIKAIKQQPGFAPPPAPFAPVDAFAASAEQAENEEEYEDLESDVPPEPETEPVGAGTLEDE